MRLFPLALLLSACLAPPARAQALPDTVYRTFVVHAPPEIVRVDRITGVAEHWAVPQPPEGGLTARLVLVDDGLGGHLACGPIANAAEVAGNLALIRRGLCEFGIKATNAFEAGALGFLVFNHDENPQEGDSTFIVMGSAPETPPITGGFLARYIRDAILPTVQSGAEVTATLARYYGVLPTTEPGAEQPAGSLGPAVPTPFTRTTTLSLMLARTEAVQVEAFDALGRRVATLHDGPLPAGMHTLTLNGAALPPGVYLIRATGETFTTTRRAVRAR